MEQVVALFLSLATLTSSLFVSPQAAIVLGDHDELAQNTESTTKTRPAPKTREEIERHKAELRAQKNAALGTQLEKKRSEMKTTLDAKKKQATEKLNTFKDTRKKQVAESICTKLSSLNTSSTDTLVDLVARIDEVLGKLETRAEILTSTVDTSSCTSLIANAKSALASAETAITTQSGKTYACSISSEATVKTDLTQLHQTLKNDTSSVREQIRAAKNEVALVANCLGALEDTH